MLTYNALGNGKLLAETILANVPHEYYMYDTHLICVVL